MEVFRRGSREGEVEGVEKKELGLVRLGGRERFGIERKKRLLEGKSVKRMKKRGESRL